jgi:hypothetical protein
MNELLFHTNCVIKDIVFNNSIKYLESVLSKVDPIIFINKILNKHKSILDKELLIISKYLINIHIQKFRNDFILLKLHKNIIDYPLTYKLFIKFYETFVNIYIQSKEIYKFIKSQKNRIKNYTHTNIDTFIKNIKSKINYNFDDTYGKHNFFMKIKPLLKYNEHFELISTNEIIERLSNIYKLLGISFFNIYNIQLLNIYEFNKLIYVYKYIYVYYVYFNVMKVIHKVQQSVELFEKYNELITCLTKHVFVNIILDNEYHSDIFFDKKDLIQLMKLK